MIWNKERECMKREAVRELQKERLKQQAEYAYERVSSVKMKFDAVGLKPSHIKTLKDIEHIPFTTKADMRDAFPYGLFAVPMKEIVRIHASSGTTGRATAVGYTKNDLNSWSEVVARIACAGGAQKYDIAQISFGYGLFTGALGLHYGLEQLGATVIPVSSGNTERQVRMMQEYGTTILVGTPSYALVIGECAKKMGVDMSALPLRIGLFGGEGHTNEMREQIEKFLRIDATENYGLSEIIGPGVAGECLEKNGMHIAEDHFYCEIIDPDTLEVLPWGEKGELVITTLSKEAMPMLRYRTRDISWLMDEPCACGRTSARMAKVQGRSDDMLIIRGVNVFPSQIESVLLGLGNTAPHYEIIVSREGYHDTMEVLVEVSDSNLLEKFSELEKLENTIRERLRSTLSVSAKVRLVEPESLKRFEGKAKRVTDLRPK